MIRVRVHPADRAGCGYIRLRWVAAALQAQGADVAVAETIPTRLDRDLRVIGAARIDADVAVFQRVFKPDLLTVIRGVKEQGVAVVIDVDDDFMALGPQHPAFQRLHPNQTPTGRSWGVLREAIQLADVVTVSTPALARKYNGVVVRNCVPRAYLRIARDPIYSSVRCCSTARRDAVREPIDRRPARSFGDLPRRSPIPVIGWTGTPTFHPGDLEVVGDTVSRLCADGVARFRAIGDPETLDVLGVPEQQHQLTVPLETFAYAEAVAGLDIGIVPLVESQFNAAKSWLKMAEYSALGVPSVVSPTPENLVLHSLGVGLVAHRPREWRRHLLTLAGSADLRAEMGGRAREVMADLTVEDSMAPAVWDAWQLAHEVSSPLKAYSGTR